MRIFVYVMTHPGDPNEQGCWGCADCMGQKRGWDYEAVIGVGGVGAEKYGFGGKVKWIGITPTYTDVGLKGPEVTFKHFRYFKKDAPSIPPRLAARIKRAPRGFMSLTTTEQKQAEELLEMVKRAPASETLSESRVKKNESGSCPSRSVKRHQDRRCKSGQAGLCD